MKRPRFRARLVVSVVPFLLCPAANAVAQPPVKSVPLDVQAYERIIQSGSRVPASQRLQELIGRFRGELEIDRVDSAEIEGHRVAWLSDSPEKRALRRRIAQVRLEALRSIAPSTLSPDELLEWRVLREVLEARAASAALLDDDLQAFPSFQQVEPPYGNYPEQPQTPADYADRIAWLRGVPIAIAEIEKNLQRGLDRGVTADHENVLAAIKAVRDAAPDNPLDSPYLTAFKTFPASVSADERPHLVDEAVTVYRKQIKPAYEQYIPFLEHTYLPNARSSPSWATLPAGHAMYLSALRSTTGLQLNPGEVFDSAIAEARSLREELNRLARENGFRGQGDDYIIAIRNDPKCAPLDAEAAKKQFDAQMQRIDAALPRLFAVLPKTRSEFEAAPDLPFAFGGVRPVDGSLKDGRPGRVRVKVPVTNACGFLTVMRHEGVPGHLFQHHVVAESGRPRPVGGWGGSPAYQEGWAEYASDLAPELGLELDPYARAERIAGRIFMAARTVVDIGVQWHGWTAEQAAAFYRETAPWAPPQVVDAVVETGFHAPTRQAMYFIGARKMQELRAYAMKELGSKFDLRTFHDEILRKGPMQLGVLEEELHDWVEREKAK